MNLRSTVIFISTFFCIICSYVKIYNVRGIKLNSKVGLRGGNSIAVKNTRGTPMDSYWKKDDSSMNIFDYNAIGLDPIQDSTRLATGKKVIELSGKIGEQVENPLRQKALDVIRVTQRFWSGRKTNDDCPTFPFCNHIPAQRPLLLAPGDLQNPNSRILYPWQNRNGNSAAFPGNHVHAKQHVRGHPNRHRQSVGQISDSRKRWAQPYGRFGGEIQMEDWSRNVYGHVMGAMPVSNDISNIGNGKDLSKTKESIKKAVLSTANKVEIPRLQNVGPGDIPSAPRSRSEYHEPHKPNKNWDGAEPKEIDVEKNKEDNKEKSEALEENKEKEETKLKKESTKPESVQQMVKAEAITNTAIQT